MDAPEFLALNWRSVAMALMVICAVIPQIYLWSKGIERRACFWLLAFVAAVAVDVVPMVIGFAGAYDIWPGLTFLPTALAPLFGPLLYFHARQLMVGSVPASHYWALAPGAVYWLYQLWAFVGLGDYRSKWAYNDAVHEPFVLPVVAFVTLGLAVWSMVQVWRLRGRYLEWLDETRSDGDAFQPSWITHFVILAVIAGALWLFELMLYFALSIDYFEQFWWDLATLFFVMLLSMEALARLVHPFSKMLEPDPHAVDALMEAAAQERDWVAEGERLKALVIEKGWHLETSLSLQTLSRRFGMNQAYVSRALNQGLNLSFSSLINGLRVEHAKVIAVQKDANLLDVALASGFGSKASFNRAFKLHTGISPSEYRRLNA